MINLITIILIYGLVIEEMRISSFKEKLFQEKQGRKRDREWADTDKKISVELALLNQNFKESNEKFRKECEEFHKQCEQFNNEVK